VLKDPPGVAWEYCRTLGNITVFNKAQPSAAGTDAAA